MYGAILGDIIGSPYEFDRGGKTKDFPLFSAESHFTDDTVMTIAVAEALLSSGRAAGADTIEKNVAGTMRRWGEWYPDAGYGARFTGWLRNKNAKPYGSCGNGSAMRVAAAGWLYDSLWRTRDVARATANVTHNHPEGLKGAEAVASAIYMARTGESKEAIRDYMVKEFGYDLSRTCDQIRPKYRHDETCQKTVPEAITAFLEGESFEDVIRTAVSLGGDCDTLTCIAGSIAEAFYGVPDELITQCRLRLDDSLRSVLNQFDKVLGRKINKDPEKNAGIATAAAMLSGASEVTKGDKAYDNLLNVLAVRMAEDGKVPCALVFVQGTDPESGKPEMHIDFYSVTDESGKNWIVLYSGTEEQAKTPLKFMSKDYMVYTILKRAESRDEYAGFVIDPYGAAVYLDKEAARQAISMTEEMVRAMDKYRK